VNYRRLSLPAPLHRLARDLVAAGPLRGPRGLFLVALDVFVLAFAVRLWWVFSVQSPFDAIYSDMGGYVDRAQLLLAHKTPADPRVLTLYPPGTHSLLALEFFALGRESRTAIGIAHALIGAIPAPCLAILTVSLIPSRFAAGVVGTLVALWYPQVSFTAYFSSELWFSALVVLHAFLAIRNWKRRAAKLVVGLVAATAFFVRPQFLLAWLIDLGARTFALTWKRGPITALRSVVWLAIPVVMTMAATSVRFHRLAGYWGLISESALNRLWADTDVCQVNASWKTPTGETWSYWFSPPSKPPHTPNEEVRFEGYIADPAIIDKIRLARLRGVSRRQRLERRLANAKLLVAGNLPWPERNVGAPPWRVQLQRTFADAFLNVVLPLAAIGLLLGRWNRTVLLIVANITTLVFAAAVFYGEARYNVPYAPFALLLAVVGVYEILRRAARIGRALWRRLPRRAERTLQASEANAGRAPTLV
jgi:hypothetical protein